MQRYVLSFGGESLIVRDNSEKPNRRLYFALISILIVGIIFVSMFLAGLFKSSAKETVLPDSHSINGKANISFQI